MYLFLTLNNTSNSAIMCTLFGHFNITYPKENEVTVKIQTTGIYV